MPKLLGKARLFPWPSSGHTVTLLLRSGGPLPLPGASLLLAGACGLWLRDCEYGWFQNTPLPPSSSVVSWEFQRMAAKVPALVACSQRAGRPA